MSLDIVLIAEVVVSVALVALLLFSLYKGDVPKALMFLVMAIGFLLGPIWAIVVAAVLIIVFLVRGDTYSAIWPIIGLAVGWVLNVILGLLG